MKVLCLEGSILDLLSTISSKNGCVRKCVIAKVLIMRNE